MQTNATLTGESASNHPASLESLLLLPDPTIHLVLINPTPVSFLLIQHRLLGKLEGSRKPLPLLSSCLVQVCDNGASLYARQLQLSTNGKKQKLKL